jgi:hypothetical protein
MSAKHALVQDRIFDVRDASPDPVVIEGFRPCSTWNFYLYLSARPEHYRPFIEAVSALGVDPQMQRIKRTEAQWHYEVLIDVPLDWQATEPRSASQAAAAR